MKILIAIALLFIAAAPQSFVTGTDKAVIFHGRVAGDMKSWLVIESHNGPQWKQNGYDPSLTSIVVDYMPMFRKTVNGKWEICFTSEIAKDIP
jgi:hypothetical protein